MLREFDAQEGGECEDGPGPEGPGEHQEQGQGLVESEGPHALHRPDGLHEGADEQGGGHRPGVPSRRMPARVVEAGDAQQYVDHGQGQAEDGEVALGPRAGDEQHDGDDGGGGPGCSASQPLHGVLLVEELGDGQGGRDEQAPAEDSDGRGLQVVEVGEGFRHGMGILVDEGEGDGCGRQDGKVSSLHSGGSPDVDGRGEGEACDVEDGSEGVVFPPEESEHVGGDNGRRD